MNKEQIIDEVYLNYSKNHFKIWEPGMDYESKESFIRKCKTDSEFSERWGLKIEERELSAKERVDIFLKQPKEFEDKYVPTKQITLTYNNETIESYE